MSRRSKKITVWKIRDATGTIVDVPVLMQMSQKGFGGPAEMTFFVDLPDLGIRRSGKDINLLNREVQELLKERTILEWTRQLLVELELEHDEDVLHGAIRLHAAGYEIAARPDGTFVHKDLSYVNARPREGSPRLSDNQALIPDTPANRRALRELALAIGSLGERLAEALHADRIQGTLTSAPFASLVSRIAALSAPMPVERQPETKARRK